MNRGIAAHTLFTTAILIFSLMMNRHTVSGTFLDDFDDNVISPRDWKITKTDGWRGETVEEVNKRIEYTGFLGGNQGVGLRFDQPINMNASPLIIEFDAHIRVQNFSVYIANAITEGELWNLGVFAFNLHKGVLQFKRDDESKASVNSAFNVAVDPGADHAFKYVLTPTETAREFDFRILIDDGATTEVKGHLNTGTINPKQVYLYFGASHEDWQINDFIHLDNVRITSDSIEGNVEQIPQSVSLQDKLPITWGRMKAR